MSKRKLSLILALAGVTLAACGYRLVPQDLLPGPGWVRGMRPGMEFGGTAWGGGSFDSNGERIYFTSTNESGERVTYSGGPQTAMMMGGYFSCASCHGPDARGGLHAMHMELMDAADIRWAVLSGGGESEGGNEQRR